MLYDILIHVQIIYVGNYFDPTKGFTIMGWIYLTTYPTSTSRFCKLIYDFLKAIILILNSFKKKNNFSNKKS